MRYEVRHVSVRSTAKFGLLIGVALAFLPSLCMATLVVQVIARVLNTMSSLSGVVVDLPEVTIGPVAIPLPDVPIDLIRQLGLSATVELLQRLNSLSPLVFLLIVLGGVLIGALLMVLPLLVFSLIYNTIAPTFGGFVVELDVRPEDME